MARRVRNSAIETREARRKLTVRGLPYWTRLQQGLHLGYRRTKGQGRWVVRFYLGGVTSTYRGKGSTKDYEKRAFADADDFSDANGTTILTFDQAQAAARAMMDRRTLSKTGAVSGPYTVRQAIDDYVTALRVRGQDHRGTDKRAQALIVPQLGEIEIASLTSERLRQWVNDIAHTGARLRTAEGKAQRLRPIVSADDARARKTTANRTLNILKAALNHAYDEEKVASRDAWGRRVKPFRNVSAARVRYLSIDEARRLINASEPGLRELVTAALQTGCRLSELLRLKVGDFNGDAGTTFVQASKSGKARHVVLTDEGRSFFTELATGRPASQILLPSTYKTEVGRKMRQAVTAARIVPAISFHILRHTWASHSVMAGVPLHVVAHNLGHSDTRMVEKHYGHLAPSYIADAIRAGAPRFDAPRSNVQPLRGK